MAETKILRIGLSVIHTDSSDGAESKIRTREETIEVVTRAVRELILEHVEADHLCSLVVGHKLEGDDG